MMEMKEQTGSRKKLLAPVVVLMLCLVTLTGAAYAYSSTMVNTGNTIDSEYLSIDLNGKGETAGDIVVASAPLIVFEDRFEYDTTDGDADKTNRVHYDLNTPLTYTYKLKVESSDNSNVTLVVSASVLNNVVLFNDGSADVMFTDKFDVKYTVNGAAAKEVLLTGNAGDDNKSSVAVGSLLTVVVTISLKGGVAAEGDIGDRATVTALSETAEDYQAAFNTSANNGKFALAFDVSRA